MRCLVRGLGKKKVGALNAYRSCDTNGPPESGCQWQNTHFEITDKLQLELQTQGKLLLLLFFVFFQGGLDWKLGNSLFDM